MTPDGQVAAFTVEQPIDPHDGNYRGRSIYARDRRAGTTMLVSSSSRGVPGRGDHELPVIAPDGSRVVFIGRETTLTSDPPLTVLFVKDLVSGELSTVHGPVGTGDLEGLPSAFVPKQWSADGRWLLVVGGFVTKDNLYRAVWVYEVASGVFRRLTPLRTNRYPEADTISGDGQWVTSKEQLPRRGGRVGSLIDTFSGATRRIPRPPEAGEHFLYDTARLSTNGRYLLALWTSYDVYPFRSVSAVYATDSLALLQSISGPSTGLNGFAGAIAIADDGVHLVLAAARGGQFDISSPFDFYRYDRVTGTHTRLTVNGAGAPTNAATYFQAATPDGHTILVTSGANNLVKGERPLDPEDFSGRNNDLFFVDIDRRR